MAYKYSLDKSSKKFRCPQCGHKSLVRYMDTDKNYLPDHVGRCDRENRCAYHCPPKQYFAEVNPQQNTYTGTTQEEDTREPDFIPLQYVTPTLTGVEHTSFVQYISTLFNPLVALKTAEAYCIGRSKLAGGRACIFWQADERGFVRSGKIVAYNATTGKRIKEAEALQHNTGLRNHGGQYMPCLSVQPAVKKLMGNSNLNLQQIFFGQHLLSPHFGLKAVNVVESEKTAVICSILMPHYTWLATGGANGCKWRQRSVYSALAGRKVTFYPDYGYYNHAKKITCYTEWCNRVNTIRRSIPGQFTVSNMVEHRLRHQPRNDQDLADILFTRCPVTGKALDAKGTPIVDELDEKDYGWEL